jgi:hypothetical protein
MTTSMFDRLISDRGGILMFWSCCAILGWFAGLLLAWTLRA